VEISVRLRGSGPSGGVSIFEPQGDDYVMSSCRSI
jgi:hypothetical protein